MPDSSSTSPGANAGQLVFVKRADTLPIPQIFRFVDGTSLTEPGFQSAFIYRHMSNPSSYSVYETRNGTREAFLRDVEQYDVRDLLMLDRNVARDSLAEALRSSVDWYKAVARWQNRPDASSRHQTSLIAVMRLQPGNEARDTVLMELYKLIHVAIRFQPALQTSVVHQNLDNPERIMLYEEWNWPRERIIAEEMPKSHRSAFRRIAEPFLAARPEPEWLTPMVKVEKRDGRIEKTVL